MQINLSEKAEALLAAQVAAGCFASPEEAIEQIIAEYDDMAWAKPLVDEALADVAAGRVVTLAEHEKKIHAHMEKLRKQYR
jgi:antitoxin ParD1/3/4